MRLTSQKDTALAALSYLSGLALAVLAAAQAPLTVVVPVALLFAALASALFIPGLRNWSREYFPRRRLRKAKHLRPLATADSEQPPADLPNGVYGFEEIFAVHGMRGLCQHRPPCIARVKPVPFSPEGHRYQIEVHKFGDETYLVGWVSESDRQKLASAFKGRVKLWMQRQRSKDLVANSLVEVPLSRIVTDGESKGDGGDRAGYRLELDFDDAIAAPVETNLS